MARKATCRQRVRQSGPRGNRSPAPRLLPRPPCVQGRRVRDSQRSRDEWDYKRPRPFSDGTPTARSTPPSPSAASSSPPVSPVSPPADFYAIRSTLSCSSRSLPSSRALPPQRSPRYVCLLRSPPLIRSFVDGAHSRPSSSATTPPTPPPRTRRSRRSSRPRRSPRRE